MKKQTVQAVVSAMWETFPSDAPQLTPRKRLAAWWKACRPPFLIVDLIPVLLGLILAAQDRGEWPWLRFGVVMLGCFLLHTVANIANDLFDHILGVDGEDTIGGSRVIQERSVSPRQITSAILLLSAGSVAAGLWLITVSGQQWLWGLLFFALFSAVFYVAPPIRYGHHGYGELFVALNMGFIMVMGSYAVLADGFSLRTAAFGLPVGLMVAGILFYQSLPEIETDRAAGKFTLAVRLGKIRSELLFRLWWPAVWVLLLNLWTVGAVGPAVALCLLTLPLHVCACRHIRKAVDWLELDGYGHLVRKLYLFNGLALIAGLLTV